MDPKPGIGRGVLDPKRRQGKFETQRFHASAALSECVEHFWEVRWALPEGETFDQHLIPHPVSHAVFEKNRSEVVGPITGRFTRVITGKGRVVGAHFKPGMLRAFVDVPAYRLVDRRPPTWNVFPITEAATKRFESELLAAEGQDSAEKYDALLRKWLVTPLDPNCLLARDLVAFAEGDPALKRSEQLAKRAGLSLRSLQRLFRHYVGVSPKFVIQRFRLIGAAEQLLAEPMSGTAIALELGYTDQAHFIRAFKSITGTTPDAYAKRNA